MKIIAFGVLFIIALVLSIPTLAQSFRVFDWICDKYNLVDV